MLERFGYSVDLYSNGKELLKTFKKQTDKYNLLVSDLTMPDMAGEELSKEIQKVQPGFPIMIMTGYGNKLTRENQKSLGIRKIVNKPKPQQM